LNPQPLDRKSSILPHSTSACECFALCQDSAETEPDDHSDSAVEKRPLIPDHAETSMKDEVDTEESSGLKTEKRKVGCNDEEVLAVLAHELGHWKLSHNLKNLVIGQVRTLS